MRFATMMASTLVVALAAGGAAAQSVGVGTTKGGAAAGMAAAIAKAVSSASAIQMRPRPMGGTQQYIPVVNAGQLEFGVANAIQLNMAYQGTGLSKGRDYSNVRMAASLMVFRVGLFASAESGIMRAEQLKGLRLPGGFKSSPLMKLFMDAFLEIGGLDWGQVTPVNYVGLRQHWAGYKQGKINVGLAAVGSAPTRDIAANAGAIQWIDLSQSANAQSIIVKYLPGSTITKLGASKRLPGLAKPSSAVSYDYTFFASTQTDADQVYHAVKALHAKEKELKAASPIWRSHKADRMARKQNVPYHPGAIRFYKEIGIWKG